MWRMTVFINIFYNIIIEYRRLYYICSIISIVLNYLIDRINITSKNKIVDLDLFFDNILYFSSYIENVSCKALKLLGFVKRFELILNYLSPKSPSVSLLFVLFSNMVQWSEIRPLLLLKSISLSVSSRNS